MVLQLGTRAGLESVGSKSQIGMCAGSVQTEKLRRSYRAVEEVGQKEPSIHVKELGLCLVAGNVPDKLLAVWTW